MLIRWTTHLGLAAGILVGTAGGCDSSQEPDPAAVQQATGGGDPYGPRGTVDPGPRPGTAGAGAPPTPQPIDPDDAAAQQEASVACLPGLAPEALLMCEQAIIRFQEIDSVSGTVGVEIGRGLGPTFNGNACAMCHAQPGVLGASPGSTSPQYPVLNPQVALATLDGALNAVPPFITTDGPVREVRFRSDGQVHDLYTVRGRTDAPGCNARQPGFTVPVSFRTPTSLFGLGLVQSTPDATLAANLASSAAKFGTGGTFNTSAGDGTIQRFGWKAQEPSVLSFSAGAYNVEQGVTNTQSPQERTGGASHLQGCLAFNPTPEDVTAFATSAASTVSDLLSDVQNFANAVLLSKPPDPATAPFTIGKVTITQDDLDRGAELFTSIGCAACHTPAITSGPSDIDPALSNVTFHPYSDFALHHMGPGLADGITQGAAGPDQFRTAPLWGVGQRLYFLHDGRTSDIGAAIRAHGGDAYAVQSTYESLGRSDRQAIIDFLRSL